MIDQKSWSQWGFINSVIGLTYLLLSNWKIEKEFFFSDFIFVLDEMNKKIRFLSFLFHIDFIEI